MKSPFSILVSHSDLVAVAASIRCPLAPIQFLELSMQLLLQGNPRRFIDVLHLPRVLQ